MNSHVPQEQRESLLFEGDYARRGAAALTRLAATLSLVMPVILLGTLPVAKAAESVAMGIMWLSALGILVLARRGSLRGAVAVLVGTLAVYGAAGLAAHGSIRGVALLAMVGAIVVGGLYFNRRALTALLAVVAILLAALVHAEHSGWIPVADNSVTWIHWCVYVGVLAVLAASIHHAHGLLLDAVMRAEHELDERARAVRALGESEDIFKALFADNPAALMITSCADQRIVDINRAHEDMFGLRRADVIGRTSQEAGLWADAAGREEFWRQVASGGPVTDLRCRYRRSDGRPFEALVSARIMDWRGAPHLFSTVTDLKVEIELRDELRRSEERFRTVFRQAPLPIVITNYDDGTILDVNAEAENLFECRRQELVGSATASLFADPSAQAEGRTSLAQAGAIDKVPVRIRTRRSGAVKRLLLSSGIVADSGVRYAISMGIDLTAESEAREALKRSEQRFEAIFRHSPIGMVITDFDRAVVIDINRSMLEMVGLPANRRPAEGESVRDFYPEPAQYQRVRALLEERHAVRDLPIRVRHADGSLRDMRLSAAVFDEGGTRLSVNMVVDTTAETRMREALEASEERFSRAFHFSPIGMTITRESDGRILEVNHADARVLGYSYGETIGRTTLETGAWESMEERARFVDRLRSEGRVLGFETRMRNKAGEWIDALLFAERLEINGEACVLSATLNVTEERRHEAEIRALNDSLEKRVQARTGELLMAKEELESFVYAVSHDLRAPLRAATGFLMILRDELDNGLSADQRELFDRVGKAAARMGELIDDLLALSRIGRQEIVRAPVNLSAMAREVMGDLAARQPGRQVDFDIADGIVVECDAALARIALVNLLGNAWKYTGKRDRARIAFHREPGEGGALTIADDGAGFDMRYADRLFKPFQRLHSMGEFEGNGIGLSTVQRIVSRHGGWISGEGRPGEGATFRFTLWPGPRA